MFFFTIFKCMSVYVWCATGLYSCINSFFYNKHKSQRMIMNSKGFTHMDFEEEKILYHPSSSFYPGSWIPAGRRNKRKRRDPSSYFTEFCLPDFVLWYKSEDKDSIGRRIVTKSFPFLLKSMKDEGGGRGAASCDLLPSGLKMTRLWGRGAVTCV